MTDSKPFLKQLSWNMAITDIVNFMKLLKKTKLPENNRTPGQEKIQTPGKEKSSLPSGQPFFIN